MLAVRSDDKPKLGNYFKYRYFTAVSIIAKSIFQLSSPSTFNVGSCLFGEDSSGCRLEGGDHVLFDEAEGSRKVLLEAS